MSPRKGGTKPSHAPTFERVASAWARTDHWPLEDACRLLLGHLPRVLSQAPLEGPAAGEVKLLVSLAENSLGKRLPPVAVPGLDDGEIRVAPVEFVTWASSVGYASPGQLREALSVPPTDEPTPSINALRKARCRALAAMIWDKEPDTTIAAMADRKELLVYGCEGREYTHKTMRGWINDLAKNRNPGRPKNTRGSG